ncbi:CPBP family intramembrane glutamic endopeptidase [Allorhodopirellula heiligendammensis]|uniref:CAAX amino terminal protease self- immunity n=1 Tax=Allorhodopirellula heiligendammensis TaxID=2714739 RepID=A0A5C6C8B4_9BACT|nr:CPBP family intramembrane glutamic endopeptidase [Allorhodopirellula heiligendammensis]TWU19676.1 CAAX amino terminal protease self- immunity [Allorhodopirellula heiligendammensis]
MPDSESDEEPQTADSLFQTAVVVEAGLGLLAVVLGYLFGPDPRQWIPVLDEVPSLAGGLGLGILATFPLLLLMAIIRRINHPAVQELDQLAEHPMMSVMLKMGPLELLAISLCAGVGEELLFRGWLMPAIAGLLHGDAVSLLPSNTESVRPWWAFGGYAAEVFASLPANASSIRESAALTWSGFSAWWTNSIGWELTLGWIASSIAFGFVHPISKLYVVVTGIMGLYFGALLILTGNLLIPIVAHALYDAIQLWAASAEAQSEQRSIKQTA